MSRQFEAAKEVQLFMQERGWRSCIIGGIAVIRWGEPRATKDVDITLLSGFGDEELFIDELLKHFRSRVSDAQKHALRNRVLLLTASNDVPVDVSLGALPFEELSVERATPFEFSPNLSLVTCSASDLVILKAFADRAIDWRDVEGILVRQEKSLEWDYIVEQLAPLCELKEAPEIVERLLELRRQIAEESARDAQAQ